MDGEELARIDVLLKESWSARYSSAREMVYLAELAMAAAGALSRERHDARQLADLRARVAAELGNAYRLADHPDRAEQSFGAALAFFRSGSEDPRLLASIADRYSSLLWHRRRIREAFSLLERLYGFYQRAGDRHLMGRTLISKGLYTESIGDPKAGLLLTGEGLGLIDTSRDPDLLLMGIHNVLWCATSLGRFGVVRALIPTVRPLYDNKSLMLLRLRWIEGRVSGGLGELSDSETALLEAKRGFTSANLLFPASMVSLDLALLFVQAGESGKVAAIAQELFASFRSLKVGREALLSLILLSAEKKPAAGPVLKSHIEGLIRALRQSIHRPP